MKRKSIIICAIIVIIAVIIVIGLMFINNKKEPKNNEIDQAIINLYENESFAPLTTALDGGVDMYYGEVNAPEYVEFNGNKYYLEKRLIEDKYVGNELFVDKLSGMTVYSVKYATSDFALTIKDEKNENYYPYITEEYNIYSVGSMEEFLEETGFYKSTKNIEITMRLEQVPNTSICYGLKDIDEVEYIMNALKEVSIEVDNIEENREEYIGKSTGLKIYYSMDNIEKLVIIDIYENGNMLFKCEQIGGFLFNTGEEGIKFATELIEYLGENCSGQIDKWD